MTKIPLNHQNNDPTYTTEKKFHPLFPFHQKNDDYPYTSYHSTIIKNINFLFTTSRMELYTIPVNKNYTNKYIIKNDNKNTNYVIPSRYAESCNTIQKI